MTLRTALTSMFESAYVIGLIIWMVLLINFLAIGIGAIYVIAIGAVGSLIYHEYFTGDDDLHSMIEDARTE